MSLLSRRQAWAARVRSGRPTRLKLAVLASYTASPLLPYLGLGLDEAGWPPALLNGPYDQIAPECLNPESETAAFAPDVLVAHFRLEDRWGASAPLLPGDERGEADALALAETCLGACRRWGATLLFVLPAVPEPSPLGVGDAANLHGLAASAARVREALRERLASEPGVLLADAERVVRQLGHERAHNPQLEALARIPYSEEAFAALGEQLARLVVLSRQSARKLLVVDADNTLWGGVVGEDGPEGLVLGGNGAGAAYCAFQAHLVALRRAGVLIALCSKNAEPDVWAAFERPEMRLKREHLSAWRVDWQPKSGHVRAIAEELGLGLDSVVFIDDNPAELAEVAAACPEVACWRFPSDPADWASGLAATGLLDRLPPTAEDAQRADQYAAERSRRVAAAAASPQDYLASLGLRARVFAPGPLDVPRLGQLVAKTNQFNLTGRRRSEAELAALLDSEAHCVRLVQCADRFGDLGAIGAFVLEFGGEAAVLDTFVLSCRAMGRGIEAAMLHAAFACAHERGRATVVATLAELPRNAPARSFFERQGAVLEHTSTLADTPWPAHLERDIPSEAGLSPA